MYLATLIAWITLVVDHIQAFGFLTSYFSEKFDTSGWSSVLQDCGGTVALTLNVRNCDLPRLFTKILMSWSHMSSLETALYGGEYGSYGTGTGGS